jgi:NAD(P)-dependent dehydrogenase (short-subunit alcohol dehydrogenase family)
MIRDAGGTATFIETDVTKEAQVKALIKEAIETYGGLNCAFNNAGIGHTGTITECTEEEWDRVMNTNLKSVWLCMKHEILHLVIHGGGAIVNAASVAGIIGLPRRAIYTVSKHGVIGLTKVAALQYAKDDIRINAVCPGPIRTGLTEPGWSHNPQAEARAILQVPMGRLGAPEEVAEASAWLCSDGAAYITGHALAVDGGFVAQ